MKKLLILLLLICTALPVLARQCKLPKLNWQLIQAIGFDGNNIAMYLDRDNIKPVDKDGIYKEYWQKWERNNETTITHNILNCNTNESIIIGGVMYENGVKVQSIVKYNKYNFYYARSKDWTLLKKDDKALQICK